LSAEAREAVQAFGLSEDLDRTPDELPYGRRRLVAMARALACGPTVLLLDEPAAGLSRVESDELGELVRRVAREWNLAVLIVEHDVSLVMDICDVITVLDFGEVICHGAPAEVAADPAVRAAYLGQPEPV
jgi:sulfate-transporting ATPase